MDLSLTGELAAVAISREVLSHLDCENLTQRVQCEAVKLLETIRHILDDNSLDDAECFHRIEAIVSAFHQHGVSTSRHDFG